MTQSNMGLAAWVPMQHLTTASLGTTATPGKREGRREGEREPEKKAEQR